MGRDYLYTLQEFFRELVRQHGHPLHMDTHYCKAYRAKHPNCEQCESEEGCRRYSQLMGLVAKNLIDPGQKDKNEQLFAEIRKILDEESTETGN